MAPSETVVFVDTVAARPASGQSPRRPAAARRRAAAGAAVLVAAAARLTLAGPAAAQALEENDPLEPFNRAVFEVNRTLDGLFIEPAAILYRLLVPDPVRRGIGNALLNLASPVTLANDLLQGDVKKAGTTLGRFALNSTVGILGFVDVASRVGLPYHFEDFGQTLGTYGVGAGPYLMLPLIGPSNPRDLTGRVVDFAFAPLTYFAPVEARLGVTGGEVVDLREETLDEVDELERTSLDFYVAVRNSYWQFREAAIRNGEGLPPEDLYEDIYDLEDEDVFEDPAAVEELEELDDPGDLDDPAAAEP